MEIKNHLNHIRDLDHDIADSCNHNNEEIIKARNAIGVILELFLLLQVESQKPVGLSSESMSQEPLLIADTETPKIRTGSVGAAFPESDAGVSAFYDDTNLSTRKKYEP